MNEVEITRTLESIEKLPTLPAVAREIQVEASNERASMKRIAAIIARDQAISARVIHLVNSAFYGFRERIGSIHHAIVILGLTAVKSLAVGASVIKTFADSDCESGFDRKRFWLHTLSCAMGARAMAQRQDCPETEQYFLAGLLHDIGILVIDQFLHEQFSEIVRKIVGGKVSFIESERNVLGFTHGDVGAFLARKWGMPEFLVNTIRFHHKPADLVEATDADKDILRVVHLADVRSHQIEKWHFLEYFGAEYQQSASGDLGINEPLVQEIFEQVESEVNTVAESWGLLK